MKTMLTMWKMMNVVLVSFIALTRSQLQSSKPEDECTSDKLTNLCYLYVNETKDSSDAMNYCQSKDYQLLAIRSKSEQEALKRFMQSQKIDFDIWTSGEKVDYGEWGWLDGTTLSNTSEFLKTLRSDQETITRINLKDQKFAAENAVNPIYVICQYKNTSNYCTTVNSTKFKDGCLKVFEEDLNWYSSRNKCLQSGGDLPIITEQELDILNNLIIIVGHSYWLGLRKVTWQWKLINKTEEEVTFTQWPQDKNLLHSRTGGKCISINGSDGNWTTFDCNKQLRFVCQKELSSSNSVTPFTSTFQTPSVSPTTNQLQTSIWVATGAVVVIVICILIIIVIIKRNNRKSTNSGENSNSKRKSHPLESLSKSPADQSEPAREMVTTSDDALGQYAEISTAIESSEPQNYQPTVYASLEFQNDELYAQPTKKPNTDAAPTSLSPNNEVYAIPNKTIGVEYANAKI